MDRFAFSVRIKISLIGRYPGYQSLIKIKKIKGKKKKGFFFSFYFFQFLLGSGTQGNRKEEFKVRPKTM